MRHITINDLAKRLQLSPSTVSRALRDHPDISKKTKERVQTIAAKTNYQPNVVAQSLQTQRSNTIGVIVPEIRNTFFSTVISGIEEMAYGQVIPSWCARVTTPMAGKPLIQGHLQRTGLQACWSQPHRRQSTSIT